MTGSDERLVLLSASTRAEWSHDTVTDPDAAAALIEAPPDVVVIDAALDRSTWRPVIDRLLSGIDLDSVYVLWDGPDSALFEVADLLRGFCVIQTLDEIRPAVVPPGEVVELHVPAPDAPNAEFVTLLGTASSVHSLTGLTRAVRTMRRPMPMPLWQLTPPATIKKSYEPDEIADRSRWRTGPSGVPTTSRPALRTLLSVDSADIARPFWEYLDGCAGTVGVPPSTLIVGRTGTGKTAMARQLHQALFPGDAELRPFVEVSGPTIRGEFFNDQFFGHPDKSYTDAAVVVGPAMQATFGTLFIDELGDLDEASQKGLLTFLVRRRARMHNLEHDVFLPMHVIAATNRPLEEMVRAGTFRQDLYNRFAQIIELAPLSERLAAPGETRRLVTALLSSVELNPPRQDDPQGRLTVPAVHADVFEHLGTFDFSTGNFRELIDVLRAGVQVAVAERSPVLLTSHLRQPPRVVEGEVSGVHADIDLATLCERVGAGKEAIRCGDLASLAAGAGVPLLVTVDGALAVVWQGAVWVGEDG